MGRVMAAGQTALAAALGLAALKVAGDLAVRNYEDVPLDETCPEGKIALVDGLRLHYLEEGQGPALALLHGLGASAFAYRRNLPELARSFRVIVPDLAGHGLSSRDAADLSLTAQARYLALLLDELGIERASICGHSMGGAVAQRFALARPERVERLVLVSSTTDGFMRRASWASPVLRPFVPLFVTAVLHNRFVRPLWSRAAVYDPAYLTPEIMAAYSAPGHIKGHTAAYQRLMMDRGKDQPIDPSQIRAPTLIVWGESDRIVGIEHGWRLEAAIPGSRLVVVPRAGHWVQEEQPEVVNRLIAEFLGAETPTPALPSFDVAQEGHQGEGEAAGGASRGRGHARSPRRRRGA